MRLKQASALLLASVMLVGSVGIMNPTEARAAGETNIFTLTVPADTNITKSGWNDIGSVGVSNVSIASDKKISVTIENGATERTLKKTGDASKTVSYVIKKGNAEINEAFGSSLDFTTNRTRAIGADVADFSTAEVGTYEDTINFTATLVNAAATPVTYERTGKPALSSENLGTPTSWTFSGKTYQVYNAFIPSSAGSSWNDAMGFVGALNTASYGGHSDWTLLSSEAMTNAWSTSHSSVARGDVDRLWASVEVNEYFAYVLLCDYGYWNLDYKSNANSDVGFVVLRGSSSDEATEVTCERTGKDALSSENLGEPTSWTYNGTTYQVYNEFIPYSSGSNWHDAKGFVQALNDASYDGHKDWTLLSSEVMARAYVTSGIGVMPASSDRGGVYVLWSSVESNSFVAYSVDCNLGHWEEGLKSEDFSHCGFVVLRGSTTSSTTVEHEKTDGTLSSANLGEPTEWEYNSTTYQVYNAFMPSSSGSSWNDAKGFVQALNDANYDGHNDWILLSSKAMATAWYSQFVTGSGGTVDCGDLFVLWSSVGYDEDDAYCLNCNDGHWSPNSKTNAYSGYGFVVLRGSTTTVASGSTKLTLVIANHDWEYTVGTGADANKLTAKCTASDHSSDDCYTKGVSLTLSASNANYSGSTTGWCDADKVAFKLVGKDEWESAVGDVPTIHYTGTTLDGTKYSSDEKPTEDGSYIASIECDGQRAELDFNVGHIFDGQPYKVNAETNKHYQECKACGSHSDERNHDFSKCVSNGDGTHKVVCADCGASEEGHDKDACSGGTATCTAKAKCSKCKAEYGSLKAHTNKTTTTKATTSKDGSKVSKCSVCGKVASTTTIAMPKTFTLSKTSVEYTGSQIKPTITVKDKNGTTIAATNYTLTYGTNKAVGKGTVKVTFKSTSNYSGNKELSFTIVPKTTTIGTPAIASDGITVKWTKNTTGAGYYIYRSVNGAAYTKVKTIESNATVSWKDTTAKTNGNKYQYKIIAYKTVNGTTYTSAASAIKTTYFLTRPTVTLANQASAIKVSWGKNAKATGYYVYKSTDGGKTYKKVKTVTSNATVSYTDTAAKTNGTKYMYKVEAYKTVSGTTYKSAVSAVKTMYFVSRPAISSLTNSAAGKMLIKWARNAKASGYEIQYSTSSSFTSPKSVTATGTTSTLSKTIGSLTKGKTYYVRIRSYKTVGTTKYYSAWSDKKSVKIVK